MSTDQGKAVVRRFLEEAWNENRVAELDDYVSVDNIHHGGAADWPFGPGAMRQLMQIWRTGFPDIGALIAEDDLVAARVTFTGTHTGVFKLGSRTLVPTGKALSEAEIFIFRLPDGKIVESWATWDRLNVLAQLGAMQI
ncbi:MAG TPA: ester cyclase [Stellaceae bacterium]|nr:ester cyclase [Stellaceae bacterium]